MLGVYSTPNTVSGVLTEDTGTWAHEGAIQAQAVRTDVILRSRRPIVAVVTSIVCRRAIEEAGVEEVVRISS